jgi:hypothetical protein
MGEKNRVTSLKMFTLRQVLLGQSNQYGEPGEARGTHNEGNKWKQHLMRKSERNTPSEISERQNNIKMNRGK